MKQFKTYALFILLIAATALLGTPEGMAAVSKLSQIANGGNANTATDQLVTVRNGNTDVLTSLVNPGTNAKFSVNLASTVNLSGTYNNGTAGVGATLAISGTITMDGNGLVVGDRVLLKDQSTDTQNGIYTVTTRTPNTLLTRATDYNTQSLVHLGDTVLVTRGSTQNTTWWAQNSSISSAIGSTPINFTPPNLTNSLVGGSGISVVYSAPHTVILNGGILAPGGTSYNIQYNNSNNLAGASFANFDPNNQLLGVQVNAFSIGAAGHFLSAKVQDINPASTIVSTTQFEMDIVPSGDMVSIDPPAVAAAYNITPSETDINSGFYTENGSTYDYEIIPYTGTVGVDAVYSAVINFGSFTDNNSAQTFNVLISWTQTSGAYTGFLVGQQINGTGYLYYDAGNVSGILDNGFAYSPLSVSPQAPDFIANGTTYTYTYAAQGTSPSGHTYYSDYGDTQTITDNNDGLPFQINHRNFGQSVSIQEIAPSNVYSPGVNPVSNFFIQNALNFTGVAITPIGYGYLPDGTGTTANYYQYTPYKTTGGGRIYGTPSGWNALNYDDASSNWYSQVVAFSVPGAEGYIFQRSPDGVTGDKWIDAGNALVLQDDQLTAWTAGLPTLTPTTYTPPALLAEKDTSSFTDVPTAIIRSLNVSTPMPYIDFQDNTNVSRTKIGYDSTTGYFSFTGAQVKIFQNLLANANLQVNGFTILQNTTIVGDGVNFQLGGSSGTKWGTATNQKQAWYAATPVVQQSGNILTALSTYGLVTSPSLSSGNITTALGFTPGAGTVTSVGLSVPGIFSLSGSPVTTSGTIVISANGTSGGIPYFAGVNTLASSALLTNHAIMLGGGSAASPTVVASLGTTTTVLHGNASGDPTFGSIVTADLPAGALKGSAGTPTCGAGCASITATSTDVRGSATSGTLATSVVVNFSTTLASAPFCTVSGSSTSASLGYTSTASALTISLSTGLTGDVITWLCPL